MGTLPQAPPEGMGPFEAVARVGKGRAVSPTAGVRGVWRKGRGSAMEARRRGLVRPLPNGRESAVFLSWPYANFRTPQIPDRSNLPLSGAGRSRITGVRPRDVPVPSSPPPPSRPGRLVAATACLTVIVGTTVGGRRPTGSVGSRVGDGLTHTLPVDPRV